MPTTNALNQVVSRARMSLGADEHGNLFVPYVADCLYPPGPRLRTDFQELELAWERAKRDGSDESFGALRAALKEVRGLPFEGTKGYEWAYELGIPQRVSAVIDESGASLARTRAAS